jgi:hypothetical protein
MLRAALVTVLLAGGWALVAQPDWLYHREPPVVTIASEGPGLEVRVSSRLAFEYAVSLNGERAASGEGEGVVSRTLTGLPDGEYEVRVSATDRGFWRNRTEIAHRIVIDTTPPEVAIEAPGAVPAESPVAGRLLVDDPDAVVTVTLEGRPVELDPADLSFVAGWPGGEPVELVLRARAVDAHGNLAETERRVAVVRPLRLAVDAPARVDPGAAVTIRVRPTAALTALRIDGHDRPVSTERQGDGSWIALVPVPLGANPGQRRWQLTGTAADGSQAGAIVTLTVNPETRLVQDVFLPEQTLALATPENQRAEAEIVGQAYALQTERKWTQTWARPLEARMTAGYGVGFRYRPGGPVSFHRGVDFAAPAGAPVAAANAGVVAIAGGFTIRGGLVIIDHGLGVTSEYMHLSGILVQEGQRVSRGQVIGQLGGTGFASGPHLHWEIRVRGESVDPLAWIGRLWP